MGKNISAHGILGEKKAIVTGIDLKNLSGLPVEISEEDPQIIIFPEERTGLVQTKLKPFGIEILTN